MIQELKQVTQETHLSIWDFDQASMITLHVNFSDTEYSAFITSDLHDLCLGLWPQTHHQHTEYYFIKSWVNSYKQMKLIEQCI